MDLYLNMRYGAVKSFILRKLKGELPSTLSYHGLHHTLDVLKRATSLCEDEKIKGKKITLVKTAALFHDAGFLKNKHAGHEHEGCLLAKEVLPAFNYSEKDIDTICGMIMATKIPQSPANILEEIICDADLDYLGRPDFYPIGRTLFDELSKYQFLNNEQDWNRLQIGFLTQHKFHTRTNQQLREPVKQKYLVELKKLVESY